MTKELFGTDGIRGIPGTYPLDDATLYGVARALGKYLLESDPKPRVLIGMDTRESGPHIAAQLRISEESLRAQLANAQMSMISERPGAIGHELALGGPEATQ